MKTIISTLIILFSLALNMFGGEFDLEKEAYVNDIPFNTELIAQNTLIEQMEANFQESYVNDIPFSTKIVCCNCLTDIAMAALNCEPYVDDIPFDTYFIALNSIHEQSLLKKYTDEAYVDDIPFNTILISNQMRIDALTAAFTEEKNVNDFPYEMKMVYIKKNTKTPSIDKKPFASCVNIGDIQLNPLEINIQSVQHSPFIEHVKITDDLDFRKMDECNYRNEFVNDIE